MNDTTVYIPVSVNTELPPLEKEVICHSENGFIYVLTFFSSGSRTDLITSYRINNWLKPAPLSSLSPLQEAIETISKMELDGQFSGHYHNGAAHMKHKIIFYLESLLQREGDFGVSDSNTDGASVVSLPSAYGNSNEQCTCDPDELGSYNNCSVHRID